MLYHLLKIILGIGIRLYYREIRVKNKERLNQDGPTIIIANHPNTLLDAWIIGQICRKRVYFMTKGTFFNTPFKKRLLMNLGMIPINRSVEEKISGVSNQASFEMCYKVLEEGGTLVVFPEGNSSMERQLRSLKSGTARIALEVERRNEGKLGVQIIPLGLVYLKGEKFRSSVLGNVGERIDIQPFLNRSEDDSTRTARDLTKHFRDVLESLLVSSTSKDQEELVDQIVEVLSFDVENVSGKELEENVAQVKRIHEQLNMIYANEPSKMEHIQQLVYRIKWQLERMEIRSEMLDTKYKPQAFARESLLISVKLLFGLPLFLFGLIHNIVPFQSTSVLMPKLVKEVEYYAPIAILLGVVFYPLNYTGFMILLDYLFQPVLWMKLVYFFAMPLSGMFAYYFWLYMTRASFKWNFVLLMITQKEKIMALRSDREHLKKLVFGVDFDELPKTVDENIH